MSSAKRIPWWSHNEDAYDSGEDLSALKDVDHLMLFAGLDLW